MRAVTQTITATTIPVASTITLPDLVRLGGDAEMISVQVSPVTAALDAFVLYGRVGAGSMVSLKSASWGTATGAMPITTGDIAAITAGSSAIFTYDVRGLDALQFAASAAVAVITTLTIIVTIYYNQ